MVEYARAAVEKAMTIQQVILRAMSGEITWIDATRILRMSARTLRRYREKYKEVGYDGLFDRRRRRPSPKRAPVDEVERVLRLYREKYHDFNVQHFVETVRREHGVRLSYSFIKTALQQAGLVKKHRARGRHRKRRERKTCFGEMLHLDGSRHRWLELVPGVYQTLIAVVDDATGRLLYAQLWLGETTEAVLAALSQVIGEHGIPISLYTDRAGWAAFTRTAGGKIDKSKPTKVGRVLAKLGVEHICAYSPQARGRSERHNRTLQGRLVAELRAAGIRTIEEANRYLREEFIARYNERFACEPADPASAFVATGKIDLDQILCVEGERIVGQDNTISFENVRMQILKQPGRRSCAGLRALVRRQLDGTYSVWLGAIRVGLYDSGGKPLAEASGVKAA